MKPEHSGFMSISKPLLSKLLAAARHNRRAITAELRDTDRIDAARSGSNLKLRGANTPEEIKAEARSLLAGVRLRKDAVIVEIVFSLPASTEIPLTDYFAACTTWAESHFRCHVLSSDVHLDEANPHCHVLLLPLQDGRMRGSDAVGNRMKLAGHQAAFHEQVGVVFGLQRPPPRLAGSSKAALARTVIDQLKAAKDAITRSAGWVVAQQAINDNPQPWAEALGLDVPPPQRRPLRSFVDIMTSPGKGPKHEDQPIGFAHLGGWKPTPV